MTEANRRTLLRSSRGIAPRPRSGALLGRESHAASLGAFQPMNPISGSFAVRALSSLSHVEESIAQGPPAMGENPQRETRRAAREGASAIAARSNRPPRRTTEANIKGNSTRTKGCRNRCVLPWAPIRLLGKEPFSCAMHPCAILPPRAKVRLRRLRAMMHPRVRWHPYRDTHR